MPARVELPGGELLARPGRGRHHRAGFEDSDLGEEGQGGSRDVAPPLTAAEVQTLRARDPGVSPWRVVRVQAIFGVICVAALWAWTGQPTVAWSALYGAVATVLPSALMARGMTRGTRNAVASAAGFMFWEMLKIGVAVAMLVIAVRVVPNLSWPALLVTMVVCIKVNWFALLWRGPRQDKKA